MTRREALSAVSLMFGGTIIGAQSFLAGCSSIKEKQIPLSLLKEDDVALLNEIGEVIIPKTKSSQGAKDVNVGAFMDVIVADCYDEEERKTFLAGLKTLRTVSQKMFNNEVSDLDEAEKVEFVKLMESESAKYNAVNKEGKTHYYTMVKQLTIWGYFSSEAGVTKALRYERVPGRYDGCVPLKSGDRAWA